MDDPKEKRKMVKEIKEKELSRKALIHNNLVLCFMMIVISIPILAIASIFTMTIQALFGLSVRMPGLLFPLLFGGLFLTTIWALFTTLRDDDKYIGGEPDIIYGLFGFDKEKVLKEEILNTPEESDPIMNWENGNLSHWLMTVQNYLSPDSSSYQLIEESRAYVKELRKQGYKMNKVTGEQFIELLKNYDTIQQLPIKTQEVKDTLEHLESSFPLIHSALEMMYQESVASKLEQAEINLIALRNTLSFRGYTNNLRK